MRWGAYFGIIVRSHSRIPRWDGRGSPGCPGMFHAAGVLFSERPTRIFQSTRRVFSYAGAMWTDLPVGERARIGGALMP